MDLFTAEPRREEEKRIAATDKNQMKTDKYSCALSSVFI
jgi:hypothetical protein